MSLLDNGYRPDCFVGRFALGFGLVETKYEMPWDGVLNDSPESVEGIHASFKTACHMTLEGGIIICGSAQANNADVILGSEYLSLNRLIS